MEDAEEAEQAKEPAPPPPLPVEPKFPKPPFYYFVLEKKSDLIDRGYSPQQSYAYFRQRWASLPRTEREAFDDIAKKQMRNYQKQLLTYEKELKAYINNN